eukprot:CAMPEP_0206366732 /NCGR_PEP_ID=MMETSP0294-20121207/3626_1 /ASSEMBLY_ACC=CAM_ASM_000327 /TAXON_ID=39354 /ORGANISM="Heterosigma akashiwo, Strain CCMP2393" /LENGTH=45 /DNA_ID= /DNA_START= /DNA_END= /DNA_ORIENTATION=
MQERLEERRSAATEAALPPPSRMDSEDLARPKAAPPRRLGAGGPQ